jgi:hypothetical protein
MTTSSTAARQAPDPLPLELVPHPDSHWSPWHVTADVVCDEAKVLLTFRMAGSIDHLRVPPPAASERTDELWRTTCLDWFVANPSGAGYAEYNLSPSGHWAAYSFDDYRHGMRNAVLERPPLITVTKDATRLTVTADLAWQGSDAQTFGCAAVLEHLDGRRAFHALAHSSGAPDFHAGACFTGVLKGRGGA